MARPRRTTKDEWLDAFADMDLASQEELIDTCQLIHRQAKRRLIRSKGDPDEPEAEADRIEPKQPLLIPEAGKAGHGQA